MDISIFLAQVYGSYMLVVGVALLMRPQLIKSIIDRFSSDRDAVAMTGLLLLVVGIPLVLIHNIWDGTWRVLITIMVWVTLIKGVVRVLIPDSVVAWARAFSNNLGTVKSLLWIMMLFSLYLIYIGFGFGT